MIVKFEIPAIKSVEIPAIKSAWSAMNIIRGSLRLIVVVELAEHANFIRLQGGSSDGGHHGKG